MPFYVVTINEVRDVDYAIEADSPEEAEAKVLNGGGKEIDVHMHGSETANIEENPAVESVLKPTA